MIVIRADVNERIGTGHIMRCLTLAGELKKNNVDVHFICRKTAGAFESVVKQCGFILHTIEAKTALDDSQQCIDMISELVEPVDWLIVDHYQLDEKFEALLRTVVNKVMVIDDLADRKHDCDLLLDQNIFSFSRYDKLTPPSCCCLIGPQFSLLRTEFLTSRHTLARAFDSVTKILVNFGGGSDYGLIDKTVEAIVNLNIPNVVCEVISGRANPSAEQLKHSLAHHSFVNFHVNVNNMADYMSWADIAIGSGGSSTWERCCLGLPTIVTALSDVEAELAEISERQGLINYIGRYPLVSVDSIQKAIFELINDAETRKKMSDKGRLTVTGQGAKLVASKLLTTQIDLDSV